MVARTPVSRPDLVAERAFWSAGLRLVAGVDEVGRGAMAGPLVAAAVVLPPEIDGVDDLAARALDEVRDSKLLSPDARSRLLPAICERALAVAVGVVEADELDEIGVGPANRLAMERAVLALAIRPEALILDATTLDLDLPQVGLIDGDARCLSIAAASIVAKVTRDRFMIECDGADPRFGFAAHKGYCTEEHLAALARHGPCHLHRRSFAPVGRVGDRVEP
jgi:ribonuclease HII